MPQPNVHTDRCGHDKSPGRLASDIVGLSRGHPMKRTQQAGVVGFGRDSITCVCNFIKQSAQVHVGETGVGESGSARRHQYPL